MVAQFNASVPPPMTPQQRLAIMLQPKSPTEILLSQSPHQNGLNWVFHDQATGQLRYVNVPYMESTGQQSASPSTPLPATTSALASASDAIGETADDPYVTTTCNGDEFSEHGFYSADTCS